MEKCRLDRQRSQKLTMSMICYGKLKKMGANVILYNRKKTTILINGTM
jgi:hypothetical protein